MSVTASTTSRHTGIEAIPVARRGTTSGKREGDATCQFHGELLSKLANAGIKPAGNAGDTWEDFFEGAGGDALRVKAIDVLKDVTRKYDKDDTLMKWLITQLSGHGY